MNNPKIHLGPEPHTDPNPTFDDGLYDVYKHGDLPWCDERVIWAAENGAQGPIGDSVRATFGSYGPSTRI